MKSGNEISFLMAAKVSLNYTLLSPASQADAGLNVIHRMAKGSMGKDFTRADSEGKNAVWCWQFFQLCKGRAGDFA